MNFMENHFEECVKIAKRFDISVTEASTIIFHWNAIASLDEMNSGIADIDRNLHEIGVELEKIKLGMIE